MKYVVASNPKYYPSVDHFDTLEAAEAEYEELLECFAGQSDVTVTLCEVLKSNRSPE